MLVLAVAFVSGILTVFSPCVLPILPIVLASGVENKKSRVRGVVTGLVLSFTFFSLLLATLVQLLGVPADALRGVAIGVLLLLGLSMLLPQVGMGMQSFLEKRWHFQPISSKNQKFWGGFLSGVSLGIVWTPCIGPVVATVATLAATSSLTYQSGFIVFAYAVGTSIPLYLIASGSGWFARRLGFFKQHSERMRQYFGGVIVLTALFLMFSIDRVVQAWTLEHLPESWTQITTYFEKQFVSTETLRELRSR